MYLFKIFIHRDSLTKKLLFSKLCKITLVVNNKLYKVTVLKNWDS